MRGRLLSLVGRGLRAMRRSRLLRRLDVHSSDHLGYGLHVGVRVRLRARAVQGLGYLPLDLARRRQVQSPTASRIASARHRSASLQRKRQHASSLA